MTFPPVFPHLLVLKINIGCASLGLQLVTKYMTCSVCKMHQGNGGSEWLNNDWTNLMIKPLEGAHVWHVLDGKAHQARSIPNPSSPYRQRVFLLRLMGAHTSKF